MLNRSMKRQYQRRLKSERKNNIITCPKCGAMSEVMVCPVENEGFHVWFQTICCDHPVGPKMENLNKRFVPYTMLTKKEIEEVIK